MKHSDCFLRAFYDTNRLRCIYMELS